MDSAGRIETADRQACIKKLVERSQGWDLIVIGGGASGLGIALEAITRGYSVLLLERFDFAKGTSSRSTKLVHGGVRYLAQGNIRLVREASVERGYLLRNAPHLVRNQVFLVPVFSAWEKLKYITGLKLYDWIAGSLSLGSSKLVSREATIQRMPELSPAGLKGSIEYHDGQFDDSRLAISLVQTIWQRGGDSVNYMEVKNITRQQDGTWVVDVRDHETEGAYQFSGKTIINATGVFVDEILRMDNAAHLDSVRVSQGIHLVLDRRFLSSAEALMIPETSDGRVLFAVPWHDKLVLGTTDTAISNHAVEPLALEEEIRFILDNAAKYLVRPPVREDVLSVFAGLRPLAAPANGGIKTKEISRSHRIVVSPSGIFTMLGGKWTTYRRMAEDMIDAVEKHNGQPATRSVTANLPVHGSVSAAAVDFNDAFYFYGSDRNTILSRIRNSGKPFISEAFSVHEETIRWAVEQEMARTVEDFLARRTRVLFLDAREARRLAQPVAQVMAALLGREATWIGEQVAAFENLCDSYLPAVLLD
ncbi:MAG: glycerol-3-phosphate dehydrogenase/oxidase [Chitinophagaceae bacterium]|nr:MAG: glycerol-3-phosphate dehydrogenase/oxidase [Chitinophagaceae bacterium]